MTRAALTHRPIDSDRIIITLAGDDGRLVTATVDGAYLRAKCWGILADIDPAGLVDAALGLRLPFDPGVEGAFSVADKIVMALAHGSKTSRGIRASLKDAKHSAGDISTRCTQLARRGLIERCDGLPGRGFHATWRVTEAGAQQAQHLGGRAA